MHTFKIKIILSFFTLLFFIISSYSVVLADTPSPSNSPSAASGSDNSQAKQDLENKIHDLETKVNDLHNQEDSLTSQIDVMDNQIQLTEYRIKATNADISGVQQDINAAGKRMKNLEGSLTDVTKVLLSRIVATYQTGNVDTMQMVLSAQSPSELFSRSSYLQIIQEHDKRMLYDTQQAKNDYANQKAIFENQKKKMEALQTQLQAYTTQLDQQKGDKQKLLTDTQGDETNYERLLAQAKEQLAGFSRFTSGQADGATLVSPQTVCDSWGCYYNQRDSTWGGTSLNGTQYTIASDGCLLTSMAMVFTHYLKNDSVTPLTINSNPDNFASYYPAYLKYTITANGKTASRIGATIDSVLSPNDPVIVGISYDGGPSPDHFLVLISGSNGKYMMNDPYTDNGHNIPFDSKYSVSSIREIDKVVMQ